MKIDVAYGRDIDDNMLEQLQYMEADAYAFYSSIDSDEDEFVIGSIPSETFKQFKRRIANILVLMKIKTVKGKRKLLGMACMSKHCKNIRYLHTVFVKASCRKQGIGSSIMRRALQEAKKLKSSLLLGVNPLNYNAIRLYEDFGFKVCKGQKLQMEHILQLRKQSHGKKTRRIDNA